MDKRLKFKEVGRFFRNMKADYKSGKGPDKRDKSKAYWRMTMLLFMTLWNGITAPILYPFWYIFRRQITNKIYKGTSWQEVVAMVDANETQKVKSMLKANGRFLYFMWTYGDLRDPLGLGELTGLDKKNNFWNRYWETGFRNCRFTTNFMEFRTATITEIYTSIDTRDFTYMHKSEGIGDSPDGIILRWLLGNDGRWGFIYEDNNVENIFYFGNTGLLKKDIGNNGRFECAYRQTDSSYRK